MPAFKSRKKPGEEPLVAREPRVANPVVENEMVLHGFYFFELQKREQRIAYSPNDIAAVQAIRSMEKSLFDLSAYYAKNQSALVVNKYLNGLGK